MNIKKLAPWLALLVAVGAGVLVLNQYFAATVDWPLVIMNVKADALKARETAGNYSNAQIGDDLAAHAKSKGIDSQISLISAEHGTTAAVLVTGLSARSCTGLEHHPDLQAAFSRIEVDGGVCVEGSTMRFWFQ